MRPHLILFLLLYVFNCSGQKNIQAVLSRNMSKIIPAAERINIYLPLIKNKRVAIFVNNTALVGNVTLIDTLASLGVNIKMIFGPEHGFRGTADDGEKIGNYIDEKTGIQVVSLYGSKIRPSAEDN